MAKYHFTNKAINDLSLIWNYTAEEWSEKQADKYYNLLLLACQELADNPSHGKNYDIISHGVRGYKSGEHIFFYQVISKNDIEIIRILHGMMDLKNHL